ncbi:MAG: sulfite exporter TauE/SafE family protein [Desulfotalea sp.]
MPIESIMLAAIQSSFLLGLLHGTNPCGHSWLVLAPFVTGEKSGSRVIVLTVSFLSGIGLACLALGASLGSISQYIPHDFATFVEAGTAIVLIILGLFLIFNHQAIHKHDVHCHDHQGCSHSHTPQHTGIRKHIYQLTEQTKMLPLALFGLGFIIMIIPCPTTAIMYGYALNAGNPISATMVFATYALATSISVGIIIFMLFKLTDLAHKLKKDWIEPVTLKLSGLIIVIFSIYNLYESFMHKG